MTHEDKVEIAAWCRINGPLPILRPDYHSAQLAELLYAFNRAKSMPEKRLTDFLLWGDKPDTLESDIAKAMEEMGVPKQKGQSSDV